MTLLKRIDSHTIATEQKALLISMFGIIFFGITCIIFYDLLYNQVLSIPEVLIISMVISIFTWLAWIYKVKLVLWSNIRGYLSGDPIVLSILETVEYDNFSEYLDAHIKYEEQTLKQHNLTKLEFDTLRNYWESKNIYKDKVNNLNKCITWLFISLITSLITIFYIIFYFEMINILL